MAGSDHLVSVRLRAITDQYDQAMSRAKQTTEEFGNKAGGSVARLGAGFTQVGGVLTKSVTLPVLALGTATLLASGNFERSMNRVKGITRATDAEFAAMSDTARHLGATTQYSASQAADGMQFLAMAGFKANEITEAMPGVLQLAAAAQMDLAQAADITTNILTGYGKEVSELGHANDVLARTMTSTNTDLIQLGEAMKYAAPVARGAGIEFEEAAAAIGLMGNAGIQGSMAGTSLRGAITRLLNPTNQVADAMDRLGLDVKNTDGSLKSITEIVEQLETSGATTADMMLIFGQRAGPAMAALVSQGSAALDTLVDDLRNADGAAQALADVNMEGFHGGLLLLKSATEALAISIGQSGLLDAASKLIRLLADGVQKVSEFSPHLLAAATGFILLLAAVGPVLTISGKLITNWGKLVEGTKILTSTVGAGVTGIRNMATALGPGGLVGAAGVAAAGVGMVVWAIQDSRREAQEARQRIEGYANAIRDAGDAATGTAERLSQMMTADMARWMNAAEVTVDDLAAALQGSAEAWDEMNQRILDGAKASGVSGLELSALSTMLGRMRSEAQQAAKDAEDLEKAQGGAATSARDAAAAAGMFGDELDDLTDAADGSTVAIDELFKAMDEFIRSAFLSENAAIRWEDSLEKLTTQVKANGGSLDINTEAGRRNREALQDLVSAGESRIQTLIEEGATIEDVQLAQFLMTEQIKETGRQLGLSETDVQSYADVLASIPTDVSTTVIANTANAKAELKQVLDLTRRITAAAQAINPKNLFSGVSIPGRASGGPVQAGQAYWVNENTPRSEIFVPATSGAIFTQAQFAQLLSGASGGYTRGDQRIELFVDGKKMTEVVLSHSGLDDLGPGGRAA